MNSAAYARRQDQIRKSEAIAETQNLQKNRFSLNKVVIDDLIVHYETFYGKSIHPPNLISVQDLNSKPWCKSEPESLINVRRESMLKFNKTEEQIRCKDCGARKIPQALVGGRCDSCLEKFNKEHPFDYKKNMSKHKYAYPDYPEFRNCR
jgi:tRNA(Ile2) C34 agmatinyltransferase TiaS